MGCWAPTNVSSDVPSGLLSTRDGSHTPTSTSTRIFIICICSLLAKTLPSTIIINHHITCCYMLISTGTKFSVWTSLGTHQRTPKILVSQRWSITKIRGWIHATIREHGCLCLMPSGLVCDKNEFHPTLVEQHCHGCPKRSTIFRLSHGGGAVCRHSFYYEMQKRSCCLFREIFGPLSCITDCTNHGRISSGSFSCWILSEAKYQCSGKRCCYTLWKGTPLGSIPKSLIWT